MDPSAKIHTVLAILTIIILYAFRRISARNKGKKSIPEPSGSWPLIGHLHLLGGQDPVCRKLAAMADECGPIYSLRLGYINRVLVVSSPELVQECFTTNDRVLATRPSIAAGRYMGYNNAIIALAPYGKYWREIRKMATVELLSNSRLESLKHVRLSEIDAVIKELHSLRFSKVNISEVFERLTLNIILKLIAGKRFSGDNYDKENGELWRYKKALKQAEYLSGVFVASDAIPWLEWLDIGGYVSSMKETAKELDTFITSWLNEHLEKRLQGHKNCESDFMDVMLSTLPDDAIISGHTRDIIVKATALILSLTGSDSTTITLTWALSLLLNNRYALKAAQEELDIHIGRDKWVEESDIQNLKYLQAIVKETLRLYPPGPVTGQREAMEDCYIGGYHVPKGTRLVVNLWKLHRDPRVWPNPSEFQPERFMTTHANKDYRGRNFEYIPFSAGRRSCPGVTFGTQVVHLTLARLLQGFDVAAAAAAADTPVDMREGLGIALPKVNPLEVVLTPRLQAELYQ